MDLLAWARGPLWWTAVAVLIGGTAWRIAHLRRLPAPTDLSVARSTRRGRGVLRGILAWMHPRPEFRRASWPTVLMGYAYHVGFAVIAFGYLPHIAFIRRLTGLSWPALPAPVVYLATGLTFVALFAALGARLSDPVRRLISGADDYLSWFVVLLPLATGMAVLNLDFAPAVAPGDPAYRMPLALHLLSVELLLVWLPFGKLSHAYLVFWTRAATGAAFERKGIRL